MCNFEKKKILSSVHSLITYLLIYMYIVQNYKVLMEFGINEI